MGASASILDPNVKQRARMKKPEAKVKRAVKAVEDEKKRELDR